MRLVNRRSRLEPPPKREKIVFPIVPESYHSYEAVDHFPGRGIDDGVASRKKALETFPYKAGAILFVNIGGTQHPDIKLARVFRLFAHYMENRDYLIPRWRIQVATKDGHWSQQWRYCWPGDVFRAYFADSNGDVERSLPTVLNSVDDLPAKG